MDSSKGEKRKISVDVGCLPLIVFFLLMWALIFGVTFEGKHYAIGCGCDEGVSVGRTP